jgi:hypothetical protein
MVSTGCGNTPRAKADSAPDIDNARSAHAPVRDKAGNRALGRLHPEMFDNVTYWIRRREARSHPQSGRVMPRSVRNTFPAKVREQAARRYAPPPSLSGSSRSLRCSGHAGGGRWQGWGLEGTAVRRRCAGSACHGSRRSGASTGSRLFGAAPLDVDRVAAAPADGAHPVQELRLKQSRGHRGQALCWGRRCIIFCDTRDRKH